MGLAGATDRINLAEEEKASATNQQMNSQLFLEPSVRDAIQHIHYIVTNADPIHLSENSITHDYCAYVRPLRLSGCLRGLFDARNATLFLYVPQYPLTGSTDRTQRP
jgi:hypothetical protein